MAILAVPMSGTAQTMYEYWFDNDCQTINSGTADTTLMELSIDTERLQGGFHSMHFRVADSTGVPSAVTTGYFIKVDTKDNSYRLFYSVDGGELKQTEGNSVDGLYQMDLDMSGLTEGLHLLAYCLVDDKEVRNHISTSYFWKRSNDFTTVVEYRYWLNDGDDEDLQTVVQNTDTSDPFVLEEALPVNSQPFRSSYFSFHVDSGKPLAFAKNDFHFLVKNSLGNTEEKMATYTDVNVSYPLDSITHLEPGDAKICDMPGENRILWYEFEAMADDTVSIRLNADATLQVFSPTGKEVLMKDSIDVKAATQFAAMESGIYYIAVHDVTDVFADKITLEYGRTDKDGVGVESHYINSATEAIYNLQGIEISEPAHGFYMQDGRAMFKK